MNEVLINGELSLSYPEGFHEMDPEELKKVYLDDNPDRFGIWDTQNHIIVSVWWHTSGSLLIKLAGDAKSVAKSTEAKIKKAYRNYGYVPGGSFRTEIAGNPAYGFRYAYTLNGVTQSGEAIVLLYGNCCYTIYYYGRKEREEADRVILNQILDSVKFRS